MVALMAIVCDTARTEEPLPIGGATTEARNQSKLWHHDCSWWGVLYDGAAHHIHRWTGTEWSRQDEVDPRLASRGDVVSDGDDLYILMAHTLESRLYKFRYDSAARSYDAVAGFPVALPIGAGAKRAVLERDGTGKLWITYLVGQSVKLIWSTSADHLQWNTTGTTAASGIDPGDTSTLVAFGGNKLGLFYTDLAGDAYHFKVHVDGDPETSWTAAELAASDAGIGEDHVNLAATPDGDVLAAIKTREDDILLLRRDPVAGWELPFHVAADGTRPAVIYDETNDAVCVKYTRNVPTPKSMRYKSAPRSDLESLATEPSFVFVAVSGVGVNNFTSTKQTVTNDSGLLGTASGGGFAYTTWLPLGNTSASGCFYEPHAAILATVLDGPAPLAIDFSAEATSPGETITSYAWDFGDGSTSAEQDPTHTFATAGVYDVVLTVTDSAGGTASATATVDVAVPSAPGTTLARISFQPGGSTTPAGWSADTGAVFSSARGYGWSTGLTSKDRGTPADATLATYVQVNNSGSAADWEYVLPDGDYEVTVVMGSPVWTGRHFLSIEGQTLLDGVSTSGSFVTVERHEVTVTDGHLTLVVGDPGSSSKKSKICSVEIMSSAPPPGVPVASATASVLAGVAPLQVDFTGHAVSPDSPLAAFGWSFGNGQGSSSQNPSHTYDDPGTYDVVFQAIAEDGDVATANLTIVVTDAPPPTAEIALVNFQPGSSATPAGYVPDTGATFDATRGYGWSRSLPTVDRNSNPDARRDTYVYVSNSGSTADWEYALPNGDYRVTVVAGSPAFTGIHHVAIEGVTVIDGVFTSQDFVEVVEHPVTVTDGRLTLTLGSPTGGSKKSKLCYLEILGEPGGAPPPPPSPPPPPPPPPPLPPPVVSASATPLSGTTPLSVDFSATATSPNGAIVTWAWDFGDGSTSALEDPTHVYTTGGTHTATLTVTDEAGAFASVSLDITATAPPPPPPGDLVARINFQPPGATVPAGYEADTGEEFDAVRGYGWSDGLPNKIRNDNPDPRLDTYVYVSNSDGPVNWEYVLENGTYEVTLVAGSPVWSGIHHVALEGATVIDAVATSGSFVEVTNHTVVVNDGRLTVTIGDPGIGSKKSKLLYLDIRRAP